MHYPDSDTETELHRRISSYHHQQLYPEITGDGVVEDSGDAERLKEFLAVERRRVQRRAAAVPLDPEGFLSWFEGLRVNGPGQGDPLFLWLANTATLDQIKWFLGQELAGEAGFDDLVALTQVKMPAGPKMEMARNLWDEFGRGNPLAVHGALLARVCEDLGLENGLVNVVWESLALANLMIGLATSRQYAYQSVGALGVIEMTAPGRVSLVNAGLRRLGIPASTRRYFELHTTLDAQHSEAWNQEVLRPLVTANPRIATLLAEGALMRLEAGKRCFAAYRAHFPGLAQIAPGTQPVSVVGDKSLADVGTVA